MRAALVAAVSVAGWTGRASGHSSLLVPPSRNAVDRVLPGWKGGSWGDGKFGPDDWGCNCINATKEGQVTCDVGQSCFWFSNGCSIGCESCDGGSSTTGGANPNYRDRCNCGFNATLNDPRYRTFNRDVEAGSAQDVYKHNPWRAPGTAPVFDACGMAGGFTSEEPGEAKYTSTSLAKQGMLGSQLPPAPSGTVWTAGSEVQTAISIRANHGGGYSFRLCPASKTPTEACFQATPLPFVPGQQTLRWANGTELLINGTYVDVGTHPAGSMWAMNPLPYSNANSGPAFPPPCHEKTAHHPAPPAGNCSMVKTGPATGFEQCTDAFCSTAKEYAYTGNVSILDCIAQCKAVNCSCFDYNPTSAGTHPFEHCRVAAAAAYDGVVPSGDHYTAYRNPENPEPTPTPGPSGEVTDGYCSGQFPYNVMILDTVSVPKSVPPGDYVLGFRWDCEKSAQVWAACADITIQ